MQYELLAFLRCPVTGEELQFQLLEETKTAYGSVVVNDIVAGLLFSPAGFMFPVLQGVPRLLVEAVYDYRSFLEQHVADYQSRLIKLEQEYGSLLRRCATKNKKTKASFKWEWSFLDAEKKDKIWEKETDTLATVFLNETGLTKEACRNLYMADIGCGHGLMTQSMAEQTRKPVIGVELSRAVEKAYTHNRHANAWFIQADLQYLPFMEQEFELVYSSGVIHHTDNTHASLLKIEKLLKPKGVLCIWLYHPQKNLYHRGALLLRKLISKLPIRLAFLLIATFIFPITFLIKKIRNKRRVNYREELIYLFDSFTPEFREEVPASTAIKWLNELGYTSISTTTTDQYGYSLSAVKT